MSLVHGVTTLSFAISWSPVITGLRSSLSFSYKGFSAGSTLICAEAGGPQAQHIDRTSISMHLQSLKDHSQVREPTPHKHPLCPTLPATKFPRALPLDWGHKGELAHQLCLPLRAQFLSSIKVLQIPVIYAQVLDMNVSSRERDSPRLLF
jgi:hypothetical protein